jgi:hypothetical protein
MNTKKRGKTHKREKHYVKQILVENVNSKACEACEAWDISRSKKLQENH